MAKRKRNNGRPPPPPPPPKSLIKLLQSDKKVLDYFTLLQANLEVDKQKWKTRAADYQKECEVLKQKLEAATAASTRAAATTETATSATTAETSEQGDATTGRKESETTTAKKKKRVNSEPPPSPTNATAKPSLNLSSSSSDEEDSIMGLQLQRSPTLTRDDKFKLLSPVQPKKTKVERDSQNDDLSSSSENEEESFMPSKQQHGGVEINDEMLGDMFDDASCESDDDSLEQDPNITKKATAATASTAATTTNSAATAAAAHPTHVPFATMYPMRLQEALDALKQLGVSLVEVQEETVAVSPNAPNDETVPRHRHLRRRSNFHVLTNLLQSLRMSTRVQLHGRKDLPPFDASNLMPACNLPTHPAYNAKKCAMKAVELLTLYCGGGGGGDNEIINDDEWNNLTSTTKITTAEERDDDTTIPLDAINIRTGLRNRQSLVKDWMTSLRGEIAEAWAVADRSARLVSTAVHYDPTKETVASPTSPDGETIGGGAKNQTRLSIIVEQCQLVQLLVHYYDCQQQTKERLSLLCRYVLSSAPSLYVEDYPKYPPVLSICIVEAILSPPETEQEEESFSLMMNKQYDQDTWKAIGVAIHVTACIWKERVKSDDDRIRDVASVQLASYERLVKLNYGDWLGHRDSAALTTLEDVEEMCRNWTFGTTGTESTMAMALMAIIDESSNTRLKEAASKIERSESSLRIAFAYCVAMGQIHVRQIDKLRHQVGIPTVLDSVQDQESFVGRLIAPAVKAGPEPFLGCVPMLAKCCIQLSSGNAAFELARSLLESKALTVPGLCKLEALHVITLVSRTPLVRVINLERRRDRRNAFQAQAILAHLLVVNAVASFEAESNQPFYFWGKHAFDGTSSKFDIDTDSIQYVATHWRPSDLHAFDKDARADDELVKMSDSERACAMSHVASWMGARRSLEVSSGPSLPSRLLRHPNHVLRLFRISGYAKGKPLLTENESMAPVPVCVILEDDAILVDRFVDRLEEVLQELPRDFHFCSLGYGRPKNAPLLPYSTHVGIPTCIWYLTGYVLSLAGAEFLQSKLPVVGPIDSWIGLRMCANWDNDFGRMIGVGMPLKSSGTGAAAAAAVPPAKDLRQIMKFRAFSAIAPLCSQRVGQSSSSTTAGAGRSWRKRDTDIVYSGH